MLEAILLNTKKLIEDLGPAAVSSAVALYLDREGETLEGVSESEKKLLVGSVLLFSSYAQQLLLSGADALRDSEDREDSWKRMLLRGGAAVTAAAACYPGAINNPIGSAGVLSLLHTAGTAVAKVMVAAVQTAVGHEDDSDSESELAPPELHGADAEQGGGGGRGGYGK